MHFKLFLLPMRGLITFLHGLFKKNNPNQFYFPFFFSFNLSPLLSSSTCLSLFQISPFFYFLKWWVEVSLFLTQVTGFGLESLIYLFLGLFCYQIKEIWLQNRDFIETNRDRRSWELGVFCVQKSLQTKLCYVILNACLISGYYN